MNPIRIIVAGGRTFDDYELLKERMDYFTKNMTGDIEIVSGTAKGADKLGEQYAKERGFTIAHFPAEWDRYGRGAGWKRNHAMARYATHCVCFWDGQSPGTKMMIDLAEQHKLKVRVVRYTPKVVEKPKKRKGIIKTSSE